MNETVAILMATYNGEKYISEQIESIICQTYYNWILYISDDGSSDGTLEIVEAYQRKYSDKIFIIEKTDTCKGAKENFNYLLKNIHGYEYYMFSDQDDVWVDNKVEIMIKRMQEMQKLCISDIPLLVYSDMTVVSEGLEVISQSFLKYRNMTRDENDFKTFLLYNRIAGCSMLFNAQLKEIVGDIPSAAVMHDYWLALVALSLGKVEFVNDSLLLYRQHNGNLVGAQRWKLFHIGKSIKRSNIEKLYIEKQRQQQMSLAFKSRYDDVLDDNDKRVLEKYILFVNEKNIFKKMFMACQYQLFKKPNYLFMYLL